MIDSLYDVAIVGGGPAGAACAISCASAGLRTLVLEKACFPRDKVCGDCINPGCWPVLESLGVAEEILAAPHMVLSGIAISAGKSVVEFPLKAEERGEIAISRRLFDAVLLKRARTLGTTVLEGDAVRELSRDVEGIWMVDLGASVLRARRLVAADGRNSTVARLLGVAPSARRDRVGLQAHVYRPGGDFARVELHLFPEGYCGVAPVGEGVTNYCMVGRAEALEGLKARVCSAFGIAEDQVWRAIAPLEREPIGPYRDGVVYVGDAARVVEPFTGEGIYYALRSGLLAAQHIAAGTLERYAIEHAALYRGRLWIGCLARWAVTHPRAGAALIQGLSAFPWALGYLTGRVLKPRGEWVARHAD